MVTSERCDKPQPVKCANDAHPVSYPTPQRRGFFEQPSHPRQRMYEALRAYFFEGRPSLEVARAFYRPGSFRVLCHEFRRDPAPQFFASPRPGPRTQPKKSKAQELIVALRKQNHSVYEIAQALKSRRSL